MKKFIEFLLSLLSLFIVLYLLGMLFRFVGLSQIAGIFFYLPNLVLGWFRGLFG